MQAYSTAFWALGEKAIVDFDKIVKRIEEGEKKILEKLEMAAILAAKVRSVDNPWANLVLKYGNNRGKLFNEEEDRFLLCMTVSHTTSGIDAGGRGLREREREGE